MTDDAPTVSIKRTGSLPQIQLQFGFAQFASFRILLWDTTGHNPTEIAKNTNTPGEPDTFAIGSTVADLDQRFITWQATISSPTGGADEQFSQTATFLQDDASCPDSPFTQSGQFTNTTATFANARFQVVD
ncbi:MAG TPA: hypothetical protein VE961_19750 [Pyrinomonadaceae bacterium]|nr:hypothetical protein [Pyrinomonadaceae bacterium]